MRSDTAASGATWAHELLTKPGPVRSLSQHDLPQPWTAGVAPPDVQGPAAAFVTAGTDTRPLTDMRCEGGPSERLTNPLTASAAEPPLPSKSRSLPTLVLWRSGSAVQLRRVASDA